MPGVRRWLLCLLAATMAASLGAAQPPPRDRPRPPAQAGSAAIRGRIFAADTGRPLRRARIAALAPELAGESRTVSTDSDGRYELTGLPAGRYAIRVTRSGYLPLRYGQRRPLEQGKPLQLLDRQTLDNVDFSLARMGLISGRVVDEFGDPIEGVNVMALRLMFFNGRRQFVPTGGGPSVRTDDAGQYRLLGLEPGSYLVAASTRETWTVNRDGVKQVMGYASTYAPSTTRLTDAQRVTVSLGKEVSNTDVALQPGRAARIAGRAVDSHGRPFAQVEVAREVRGNGFYSIAGVASASVTADGTFAIDNVPPGDYILSASRGGESDVPEAAFMPITVDGTDLDDLIVIGSLGGTIAGQVLTESGAAPALPRLQVTVRDQIVGQPSSVLVGAFKNPGTSDVADDGAFTINGVFGRSRLRMSLPDGWAIKSAHYEGRDILDTPIEMRSGETWSGVQLIITDRVSTVAGHVSDERGHPAVDGTIVVFAVDAGKWTDDSRYVRSARADQEGGWQIKGLPPGDPTAARAHATRSHRSSSTLRQRRESAPGKASVDSSSEYRS
ncbi:MAG TPA: carboxypeptidase-like regulatory domain-containing protein [Vicinamibacterales bacterium]|nr:carboxypeptidase-like regulatory domain-containing protein [Vicinamibacterales bacterium]